MKLGILKAGLLGLLGLVAPPFVMAAEPALDPEPAVPQEAMPAKPSKAAKAPCLQYTGSRIRPPAGRCTHPSGRVYSREDIERAGGVDLNDALRRLDPSLH